MVPSVFNTGEVEHLGLAGSIPVRLRHPRPARFESRGRFRLFGPLGNNGKWPLDPGWRRRPGENAGVTQTDPRRLIPRTDHLLGLSAARDARVRLGEQAVRVLVRDLQEQARAGTIRPDQVESTLVAALAGAATPTLTPVLNATGVVVHTNLGRAPLSPAAVEALIAAAGSVDVELVLATGARLREVGTTNRTHPGDYAQAIGPDTGCLLKVHPSNFRVEGFTAAVGVAELHALAEEHRIPLVVDIGSGLLAPDPLLADEPDAATGLTAGADVVTASGDKLLGGPQAGLVLGRADLVQQLSRHPLARAVRADKLALAALEATLTGGSVPVTGALHADSGRLRARAERLAEAVGAPVVPHYGRVGGGGAPGVPLPGWAVRLPESAAAPLRTGRPAVLPRVHDGACLVDLRCIPEADDEALLAAVRVALGA